MKVTEQQLQKALLFFINNIGRDSMYVASLHVVSDDATEEQILNDSKYFEDICLDGWCDLKDIMKKTLLELGVEVETTNV